MLYLFVEYSIAILKSTLARAKIKECTEFVFTRAEKFSIDPVEAEQNRRCSLRNTRVCVRRQEKSAEQIE